MYLPLNFLFEVVNLMYILNKNHSYYNKLFYFNWVINIKVN